MLPDFPPNCSININNREISVEISHHNFISPCHSFGFSTYILELCFLVHKCLDYYFLLINWPFYYKKTTIFNCSTIICSEIYFDINISIPAFIWLLLSWHILFQCYIFNLFLPVIILKVSFLWKECSWAFFFLFISLSNMAISAFNWGI